MSSVLVTGGAGYIGSVVVREFLRQGYRVICLDNLRFGGDALLGLLNDPGFQFVKADLRDPVATTKALENIEFESVVHLAAIVGDPACRAEPELARETNDVASRFLFDYCREREVSRFVFASTCSNYGRMDDSSEFVTEESPLAPVSLYAELKVGFEQYLLSQGNSDICTTVLRFSTVYGLSPRMRFDLTVNEFTRDLAMGRELVIFGEQFWRPYCHVFDFSRAFQCVLETSQEKVSGQVFNVGDSTENYTKKMLADMLVERFPAANIRYVRKNEDPRDYRVNFDKIQDSLNFDISRRVGDGMDEIRDAIEQGVISNPDSVIYSNIEIV